MERKLSFRLSDDVYQLLEMEKTRKGYKSISALLRAKLENEVRDERLFSEFRSEILHYKNDMIRIGTNLNQIAHKLHLFVPVGAEELAPNLAELNKIMVHLNLGLSEAIVNVNTSRG